MALGDMRPTTREAERKEWQYTMKEKDEEIKRLKKEKEWLIDKVIDLYQRKTTTDMPEKEMEDIILEEMQQALKKGK